MIPEITPAGANYRPTQAQVPQLMQRAQELEATFLAEMLGMAGLGENNNGDFNGGVGEEQFSSFLRAEQAKAMVARGGIGLAEAFFRAMGGQHEEP